MTFDIDRETVLAIPVEANEVSIQTFFREMETLLAAGPATLHVDCALVERAVSGHVKILWAARRRAADSGVPLVLTNVSPMTLRVLQILDVADLFDYEALPAGLLPPTTGKIPILGLQTYRQRFPVSAHAARQALRRMHTFLGNASLPSTVVLDVQTIAYELLQNIVSHSGADATDDIQMEVECDPECIRLMISDHGSPFDLTSQISEIDWKKAVTERRTHGFGLLLIRRLADRVRYERCNGRNVVTIMKKVG